MKNKLHSFSRSFTATTVLLCMLFGIFAPTVMAQPKTITDTTPSVACKTYLEEAADKAEDEICSKLADLLNKSENYADAVRSETYAVLKKVADYTGISELASLCNQLQDIYAQLESATTPEQRERLEKKTDELISRLQEIAAMATANELQPNYYVSIGDSTLTGYGLDEYVPGMNNGEGQVLGTEAPVLLAQRLFGEDYEDHFRKLDKGGLRVEDLLVWLGKDEFVDDFYTRYTMNDNAVESKTEYYQHLFESEIKKADLITLAIGGGNITNQVGQQINAMKKGIPTYEMDWSRYYPDVDITEVRACTEALQEVLSGVLPEISGVPAEKAAPIAIESFLFGLIGYMKNYSKVADRIHEINPDAHIVIVSYFNSVDDLEIPVSVGDETIKIPVGKMLDILIESCNTTSLEYALENNDYATFVSIRDTTTILDEQGVFDYKSQLNGMVSQTWLTHSGPDGHVYIADQIYDSITNEYTDREIALEVLYAFADYTSYLAKEFGDELIGIDVDALCEFVNEQIARIKNLIEEKTAKLEEKLTEIEVATVALKSKIELFKEKLCAVVADKKADTEAKLDALSEEFNGSVAKFSKYFKN